MTVLVYVVAAITLAAAGATVWLVLQGVPWLVAKLVMRRSDLDGELERLG